MGINPPPEIKGIESLAGFKKKLRNGNLMIAPVVSVKFSLAMSVSFKNQSIIGSHPTKLFNPGGRECCREVLTGFSGVGS